jgi:hypothetical protein
MHYIIYSFYLIRMGCFGSKDKVKTQTQTQVKPGTVVVTQPAKQVVVAPAPVVTTQQVVPSTITTKSKLIDKNL